MILAIGILIIFGAVLDAVANGFVGIHVFFIIFGAAISTWQFIVMLLTKVVAKTKVAFLAPFIARISPIVLLALVFLVSTRVYAPNKELTQGGNLAQKVVSALELNKQGKYDEGLKALSEVLANDPLNSPARIGVAEAYLGKKDYKNVRIQAQELLRFDPHQAKGYELIGDSYWQEGDLTRSIHYYNLALREDESSVSANIKVGTAYGKTHSYAEALQSLKKALELAATDDDRRDAEVQLTRLQREIDEGIVKREARERELLEAELAKQKESEKGADKK